MAGSSAALGIDLGGTKIEALLLDAAGRETWRRRIDTPAGSYDGTLQAIATLVDAARAQHPGGFTIGLGTPGSLTADGVMKNANSTCLNGRPLQRDLESLLGQPVRLANDANCLALSEATDGAAAGAEVSFSVILGTGCGAGITVRGRTLTGPNRLAGEWGHNPLPWLRDDEPRPRCYCGQHGCTEALLSGPGLAADHERTTGQTLTAREIHRRATEQADAACAATLERHASRLARALAAVINVLDPDVVVLAGGLSQMPHLYTRVPALWSEWIFSGGVQDAVRTRLVPSRHGDASGVRGAAWLWSTSA